MDADTPEVDVGVLAVMVIDLAENFTVPFTSTMCDLATNLGMAAIGKPSFNHSPARQDLPASCSYTLVTMSGFIHARTSGQRLRVVIDSINDFTTHEVLEFFSRSLKIDKFSYQKLLHATPCSGPLGSSFFEV
jgi:hypothetical protein